MPDGYGMTMITLGIREDSNARKRQRQKRKRKTELLSSDGMEMRQRSGTNAIGPMKMRQDWQSQGWGEWQEDYYDENGYCQGKGKKGKKGKGTKGHEPQQDQGKGQGDGKGEAANYLSPSQTSQAASSLPSSSNASGFCVTHCSVDLTSIKMIECDEQQKEPDFSGWAFLGQEPDSCKRLDEEGIACHKKQMLAILDLGCSNS